MKSAMFSYGLPVAALMFVSTTAFASSHGSMQIPEQVLANGQSLSAGDYQVKWDGEGPSVDLKILRDGKLVATVHARAIELQRKDPQDSLELKRNSDGTESLSEIHFGGKKYAFAIGDEHAQMNSGGDGSK